MADGLRRSEPQRVCCPITRRALNRFQGAPAFGSGNCRRSISSCQRPLPHLTTPRILPQVIPLICATRNFHTSHAYLPRIKLHIPRIASPTTFLKLRSSSKTNNMASVGSLSILAPVPEHISHNTTLDITNPYHGYHSFSKLESAPSDDGRRKHQRRPQRRSESPRIDANAHDSAASTSLQQSGLSSKRRGTRSTQPITRGSTTSSKQRTRYPDERS